MHSQHVAGIIGHDQTEFGVSRLAQIESLDVFRGLSEAVDSSLIAAYEKILTRSAPTPILNLSHGIGFNTRVRDALHRLATERDSVCVIGADNQGRQLSPQHITTQLKDDCIIVGSLSYSGIKSDFSNYGSAIGLVAPGEYIISLGSDFTHKNRWLSIRSGTSMAAPMVSGIAVILKAMLPNAHADDIRNLLYQTAVDLGFQGRDDFTGYGMANAYRAVWVAEKILKTKKTSAEEIHAAIKNSATFDQRDVSRQKFMAAMKFGSSSPQYKRELRRAALLDGHVTSFMNLGKAYERDHYPQFGLGLQIMAANHPLQEFSAEDLGKYGKRLAKLQSDALKKPEANPYVLRSLSNTKLIRQFEQNLPPMDALALSNLIQIQITKVTNHRMAYFVVASPQKLSSP